METFGFRRRLERIKNSVFSKPISFFYFILFFVGYIFLNGWVNKLYVTFPTLLNDYRLSFAIPFFIFNFILVPLLFSLAICLSIMKFSDLKELSKKGGSVTLLGIFSGLLGGACAGCFVGLFPAVLGIFGLTASLSVLPFYGLELQLLSVALLTLSIYYLTNDTVCKTDLNLISKNTKK